MLNEPSISSFRDVPWLDNYINQEHIDDKVKLVDYDTWNFRPWILKNNIAG